MFKLDIKILTLALIATAILATVTPAESALLSEKAYKTHHRLNIFTPKEQLHIIKSGATVKIQTLNLSIFEELKGDFSKKSWGKKYVKDVAFSLKKFPENPATIILNLHSPKVELFSFYRENENKYIIDFWINDPAASDKLVPIPGKTLVKARKALDPLKGLSLKKVLPKKIKTKGKKFSEIKSSLGVKTKKAAAIKADSRYRDFRYGASFIWNYEPHIPAPKKIINLKSKTPEFFYPIKDRDFEKDKKEAKMQLTINLFRKEKFGLMEKSITLYERTYGQDSNAVMNDYLRANALMKSHIYKNQSSLKKSAMNLYADISERAKDYNLQRAIYLFLIQIHIEEGDYVQSLKYSKKLFVKSRADFDTETAVITTKFITFNLAMLKQVEKIDKFVSDGIVQKLMPGQLAFAYKSYVFLVMNKEEELIKLYENEKAAMTKPIMAAISYNIAEAYFRTAQYQKAVREYDQFLAQYSYMSLSSFARVRLALCYDLLEKKHAKTLRLYLDAINKSVVPQARYEAKLRYVGLSYVRKKNPGLREKDNLVFLKQDEVEKKSINQNLKKQLWLVRLRSLINGKKYLEALSYLKSIPLPSLKLSSKRVYEEDGAEIVYGLMQKSYMDANYSRAVRVWEVYSDKYLAKVSQDPYINFLVGKSYLRLGLTKSFERLMKRFSNIDGLPKRTFPEWVERDTSYNKKNMRNELLALNKYQSGSWDDLLDLTKKMTILDFPKLNLYRGYASYKKKNYNNSIKSFENFIIGKKNELPLNTDEMGDLLVGYSESLYEKGRLEKFRRIADALVKELELKVKDGGEKLSGAIERIEYLYIETIAGMSKPDFGKVESRIKGFLKKFPISIYDGRLQYLLGKNLIKNFKTKEAEEVLKKLVSDEGVSSYIKELAKSELSELMLNRRNL